MPYSLPLVASTLDPSGEQVRIPSPWKPGGNDVRTYRVQLPDLPGFARYFVRFSACATEATVAFEGRTLGAHRGDWVPFEVEVEQRAPSRTIEVVVQGLPEHPTRGFLPTCGLVHRGLWQPVTLEGTGPWRLGRDDLSVREEDGRLLVKASVDGPPGRRLRATLKGPDGRRTVSSTDGNEIELLTAELPRWSPACPALFELLLEVLSEDGQVSDHVVRQIGFRRVCTDGDQLTLNGVPFLFRGILHWGYYPEIGAPFPDVAALEDELRGYQERGFNGVKCCLFVPPTNFLELCDRLGLLVWIEYPLWQRPLLGEELISEYEAFFRHDRLHPSVVLRTLTCENDAIDDATVAALTSSARRLLPGELVAGNSAWLALGTSDGDFYDEHPYLHTGQWPYYLRRTAEALSVRRPKPLLLGEAVCADQPPPRPDMEIDPAESPDGLLYRDGFSRVLSAWNRRDRSPPTFVTDARRTSSSVRRDQLEKLRLRLPGAGYVINGARDIPQCPVGIAGVRGHPKTSPDDFAWQQDTVVIADWDRRSFLSGEEVSVAIFVSHFGSGTANVDVRWSFLGTTGVLTREPLAPGSTEEVGRVTLVAPPVTVPTPAELVMSLGEAVFSTRVWFFPDDPWPDDVLRFRSVTEAATAVTLGGAAVVVSDRPVAGGWRSPEFTFWSFMPYVPNRAPFARLRELLIDLLPFDLMSGRTLLVLDPGAVDIGLEVLDLHGEPGVATRRPLTISLMAGEGRILVTALDHESSPAGRWLLRELALILRDGRSPKSALSDVLEASTLMLEGPWTLTRSDGSRRTVVTGTPRVNSGDNVFEGFASFAMRLTLPLSWANGRVYLRAEAVGDAYALSVDGREVFLAGDRCGVMDGRRDVPSTYDVTDALIPGREHEVRFDVRDWRGGGGMVGPVYLSTSKPEERFFY